FVPLRVKPAGVDLAEQKAASIAPLRSPANNKPSAGNSAPQLASHASGATRARCSKRVNCLFRSTAGSLRVSIRAICEKVRRCYRRWKGEILDNSGKKTVPQKLKRESVRALDN